MTKQIDFKFIRNQIIGKDFSFKTPFGNRLLTYADFTASGRSLKFIEKFLIMLQREYANTHTEDDITGRHMTGLLHKAEKLIKKSFNAQDNCYIISIGTGSTGAISKMQEIIGVYLPPATKLRLNNLITKITENNIDDKKKIKEIRNKIEKLKPVVFIGPYEHHSNDIMWRENLAEVVVISLNDEGFIDLQDLKQKVSDPKYKDREKIGSFSAASNVTGIISPVYEIARILHENDAVAFFDFAASAPYVEINMNKDKKTYFDAVFISPHKFIGGPGSNGLLVFNKKLYNKNIPPTSAAGGTVDYVSDYTIDYIDDVETREKPGTPGILQIIKTALVIDLKNKIGIKKIEEREAYYTKKAFERLSKNPNIQILGPQDPDKRICIFSFLFKHKNLYIHPKLGTKLLNDLFGIQSRAGCSCAGPYGHSLLGIGQEESKKFRKVVQKGILGIKPGWIRVNFHYSISKVEFNFICNAIEFLANNAYKFIDYYSFDIFSGDWNHCDFVDEDLRIEPNINTILDMDLQNCFDEDPIDKKAEFAKYLKEAEKILEKLEISQEYDKFKLPEAEEIRWFNFKNEKLKTETENRN